MTSNQLTYWRQEQDKVRDRITRSRDLEQARHNTAMEAETQRHNIATEDLEKAKRDLEQRGLDIKDNQQILELLELYNRYGSTSLLEAPPELRSKLEEIFGFSMRKGEDEELSEEWVTSTINAIWNEIKRTFGTVGSNAGSILKALF